MSSTLLAFIRRSPFLTLLMVANASILLGFGLSLGGCAESRQAAAMRQEALDTRASLTATLADARQRLLEAREANAPPTTLAAYQADIETLSKSGNALDAAIQSLDQALSDAAPAADPLSQTARDLAPLFPDAARAPVLLGAALAAALFRARQLKTALSSVARSIEKAKQADEAFRDRFAAHANTFRTIQTPAAQAAVDSAQRSPALSFPF